MLAGKGFADVINLTGGIKAWDSGKAVGAEDVGLSLFSGGEELDEVLLVAYSLEKGLQDFYTSMADTVVDGNTQKLFKKLAAIETKHQQRLFEQYREIKPYTLSRHEFERDLVVLAMEGGLTTREYLELYQPDLAVESEVVSLAMAIEAQALDLYQRAAWRASSREIGDALVLIAEEERTHIKQLGALLDA